MLRQRKDVYKANGISYFRPWLFLITDGGPTDAWADAAKQVQAGESSKAFSFFAVAVEGANLEMLRKISPKDVLKLKGLGFRALFNWLSASQSTQSRSTPGDAVPLQNPVGPTGWASI